MFPKGSSTITQTSPGEATLLYPTQFALVEKEIALFSELLITLYVMVKAMPEHGAMPPHSLPPELSIVVTSTTPGPLAYP